MHAYLRSVGFSGISSRKEMNRIMQDVIKNGDRRKIVEDEEHHLFVEISKEYGYDCGLTVCGEVDEEEHFHADYCFPFYHGSTITSQEDLVVERHADKLSFAGACDDYRLGITMIFYLQNAAEYLSVKNKELLCDPGTSLTLSALSREGVIILPVKKEESPVPARLGFRQQNKLMDVYSMVDSYFMPYGIECDQYHVMGEIMEYDTTVNEYTGEKIHLLNLICNDIPLDVCINDRDLMGIPEVGRRFKGVIWLQGRINF